MEDAVQQSEPERQAGQTTWFVSRRKSNTFYISLDKVTVLNGAAAKQLLDFVVRNVRPGEEVVLDFQGVSGVDGKGLALLLYLNKRLAAQRCSLQISNPSATIRKIFWITEIDQLIPLQGEGYGLYYSSKSREEKTELSHSFEG